LRCSLACPDLRFVADVGSGDGRVLICAVQEFNVSRAVGIELDRHLVSSSRATVAELALEQRIQVLQDDCRSVVCCDTSCLNLLVTTD
jgi:tRNA1(Val) A37 N6-methylase TrmN6